MTPKTSEDGDNRSLGRRLLKSGAQFAAGSGLALLATMARLAVAARVMVSEENGIWLGLQLLMSYGANLHLGALFGMARSIPLLSAQGRDRDVAREKGTAFTFVCAVGLAALPVLYGIGRVAFPAAGTRHLLGTLVIVFASLLRGYYVSEFKAESRFAALSVSSGTQALVTFASLPLIVKFHLDGLIASVILQGMTEIAALAPRTSFPGVLVDRDVLLQQLRIGIMALAISLGTVLLTTMDRTVMLRRLGVEATGQYFVGANVMIMLPIIVSIPAAVITPQFFHREGRGEDLTPLVEKPLVLTSLAYSAVVMVAASALGPIVSVVWPRLESGNTASIVATFATCPLVFANLVSNVFYAKDRQRVHAIILVAAAVASLGFAEIGVALFHTIVGAVAGSTLATYLYFPAETIAAFYLLGSPTGGWRLVLRALAPVAYAALVTVVVVRLAALVTPRHGMMRALVAVALSTLCATPLLLRARALLRTLV